MRTPLRNTVAALAAIGTVLGLGVVAYADDGVPMPTTQQLADAQADVNAKAHDVAALQGDLAAARASLAAAQTAASIASEDYNGAIWRLSESRKASRAATARADALVKRVQVQRDGMARLVVQSYQDGTQINSMTAILDADGPASIMGRQAVVDMARSSLDAGLQRFKHLSAEADQAQKQAAKAAAEQARLADSARSARDSAIASVNEAAALEGQISAKRNTLVAALAKSQNISLALARQRQDAIEAAQQGRAEAEARKQAAAAAQKDREKELAAQNQAHQAAAEKKNDAAPTPAPSSPAPVDTEPAAPAPAPDPPAPAPSGGVQAALNFARAQIGEPYRWAAAGPNAWDCSGLTMKAWAAGGKYLPHYSRAQFDMGTRIPISQARPGDLYFWSSNGRPSGIHHVAISTGDGDFIEAPRTGLNVRYNNIDNWFPTYAVRL